MQNKENHIPKQVALNMLNDDLRLMGIENKDHVVKMVDLHMSIKEKYIELLQDEPIFMRSSRVEKLLDITPSTRKRLINSKKLKAVKTGESQQSAMRITKDSVIDLISKLELEAVHQCDDCPEKD